MLKSRRGLLAAGISAIVIGSIGVVSTLNAGAEEIPASPAPAVAPAESEEPLLTPPDKLPWGAEPEELEVGRDGASSKSLKSSGFDAAAPDATGEELGEVYAPKGQSSSEDAPEAVPPTPPGLTAKAAKATEPVFHYNAAYQDAVTQGTYANLTIHKPKLDKDDYHTLAELAVVSGRKVGDQTIEQIVEVGWTVDRTVNKDDDPHLFVFSWVESKPRCYNGCGFVQYSKNIRPGDTLPLDTTKRFGIEFSAGAWWIAYDSEWVGYFPISDFPVDFSKTTQVKIFGEVASPTLETCTQMGNGLPGTDTVGTPARIGSISLISGPTVQPTLYTLGNPQYQLVGLSARTFRYGGPDLTKSPKCATS
ncbi:neprosin family prolyl endopeptidase [Actinoplanes subglobosus]|uniref:neprosin family prolyl endopeptidase n=1 Tax=Actinoplanes subglobosus TaxID=1547892 RepID=UPI00366FDFFD